MKKIATIISLILIATIFIVICSSFNNSFGLYLSNYPDDMTKMGMKYCINNLANGNYEIEFTASEYEYGVLKNEHTLHKSTIAHSKSNTPLKVGVDYKENSNSNLKVVINDSEHETSLDCLNNAYNTGMALSILNEDKFFNLNNEVAIAMYSIGGENNTTVALNIDEEFEINNNNLTDVVIYMKLHKTN